MERIRFPKITRGDLFYVDFGNNPDSVASGVHPAMVIQNNVGNWHSRSVIVAIITTGIETINHPIHIPLLGRFGLHIKSVLLMDKLYTVDKTKIGNYIGHASNHLLSTVDESLAASVGLTIMKRSHREKKAHNQRSTQET